MEFDIPDELTPSAARMDAFASELEREGDAAAAELVRRAARSVRAESELRRRDDGSALVAVALPRRSRRLHPQTAAADADAENGFELFPFCTVWDEPWALLSSP